MIGLVRQDQVRGKGSDILSVAELGLEPELCILDVEPDVDYMSQHLGMPECLSAERERAHRMDVLDLCWRWILQ